MSAVLRVSALGKRYGELDALRDVSFQADAGELIAVVGPNGAGKTTLLSIIAGIQQPTVGSARSRGAGAAAGRLGAASPRVYSKLSVAENLELFARLEGVADPRAAVARMLEQTGLGARASEPVGRLSGGNRQRVNVALGLIGDPPVLALDEPSASLDPASASGYGSSSARGSPPGRPSCSPPTTSARPSATPTACSCSPKGGCCSTALPRRCSHRPRAASRPAATSSRRSCRSCARMRPRPPEAPPEAARWLLRKDLLILGRSRLLLALLIVYPVAIALLIGLAISRSPSRPRVAIVDETPPGETVKVGDRRVSVSEYAQQLFDKVQAVDVPTRAQAVAEVRRAKCSPPS